jgi:hypothetical protein
LQQKAPIEYKYYSFGSDGFCSSGITFYPKGMVILSGGCEAREHVSYGRWKLVGDSVEISPSQGPSQSLIKNISWSAQDTGDSTTFIITDVDGRNPFRFFFDGICENVPYRRYGPFGEIIFDPEDTRPYAYMILDTNFVKMNTEDVDSLVLSQLEVYSRQKYVMSTKRLPDTVYIQMAVDVVPFYYNEIIWDEIEKPFKHKIIYKDAQRRDWDIEIKEEPKVGDE